MLEITRFFRLKAEIRPEDFFGLGSIAVIILIFALIILIPLIVTLIIIHAYKRNRERKKKLYTGFTTGIIDRLRVRGSDEPTTAYVSYYVNGIRYQIKETLKMRSETIKIGKIPIGMKKFYRLGNVSEGSQVLVQYDPMNPAKAILSENDGIMTG